MVWAFLVRNEKIHRVAAGISAVTVKFRLAGWLVAATGWLLLLLLRHLIWYSD